MSVPGSIPPGSGTDARLVDGAVEAHAEDPARDRRPESRDRDRAERDRAAGRQPRLLLDGYSRQLQVVERVDVAAADPGGQRKAPGHQQREQPYAQSLAPAV